MSEMTLYYFPIKGRNYEIQVVAKAGGLNLKLKSDFVLSELRSTLPFGQVPYLIDGDVKFAQSNAMIRYLARKGGIQGDTDEEFALSEMLIEEARDILSLMERAVGAPTKNAIYDELFAETGAITRQLAFVERLLSEDRRTHFSRGEKRLAGEYVISCTLDAMQMIQPTALDAFPKLKKFFDAMFVLPAFEGVKDMKVPAHFLRDP